MQEISPIVSAGVGPIIVISAAGLLCLAFYNRLTAVVTRLRGFDRERLQEQQAAEAAEAKGEAAALLHHRQLLTMLRDQTELVRRRAHLIQRTLFCLLSTIICLALCSLALGLSTIWPSLVLGAVLLFVAGLLLLIFGASFALLELRRALHPIEIETLAISGMTRPVDVLPETTSSMLADDPES
jgi:hypothetical protein